MKPLLLLIPLCFLAFQGNEDAMRLDIATYQYTAQISTQQPKAKLNKLELPLDALAKLQSGTGDIRIYDASFKEVPYVLSILSGEKTSKFVTAEEISRARKAGQFSELIVQIPQAPQPVNEIILTTTSANFRFDVVVEGSNDLKDWLQVGEKLSIFDYTEREHYSKTSLDLPRTQYRYYRIRVKDGAGKPFEFTGAKLSLAERGELALVEVPAEVGVWQTDAKDKSTSANVRIPAGAVPIAAIELQTSTKEFMRIVEITASDAALNKDYYSQPYGKWEFYRREGAPEGEGLTQYLQPTRALESFTLKIRNEDNQPLENVGAKFYAYKHVLYFPGDFAPPLKLIVCKPNAAAPNYDFAAFFRKPDAPSAAQASLLPLMPNPQYIAPKVPVVQRVAQNPLLLYGAYALALLTLILLVLQALRKAPGKVE